MPMSSHSHLGEAGRASRANQTNKSTCTDLTSSQPTQHYGPSQTNLLQQLRRDGDARDDEIHPNYIIYIAKTIYVTRYMKMYHKSGFEFQRNCTFFSVHFGVHLYIFQWWVY